MKIPFEQAFEDITKKVVKIPKSDYQQSGIWPIVDQGDGKIAGYTNRQGVYTNTPVVLFGDHTRVFKYIDYPFFAGADGAKILKAKKGTDPHFGYYSFLSNRVLSLGYSRHFKMLKNMPFYTCEYDTQLRIAGILGSLDEKIEANRRKITELEALVKTIYDYWFVQFDFPDANGRPYKSSGGEMEWKEELKREVPRGWDVVTLFSIADIVMGQSPPGKTLNEIGRGTLFFQGSSDFGEVSPQDRTFTTEPKRMARQGDILLSVRAPVGATNMALSSCCIGRGLAALRGRNCCNVFIQQTLKTVESRFAAKNVDGTTFGSLSRDELRGILLAKPASDISRAFDEIASPIGEAIRASVLEIQELTKQRDMLLPLLMNGQVEMK